MHLKRKVPATRKGSVHSIVLHADTGYPTELLTELRYRHLGFAPRLWRRLLGPKARFLVNAF